MGRASFSLFFLRAFIEGVGGLASIVGGLFKGKERQ